MKKLICMAAILGAGMLFSNLVVAGDLTPSDVRQQVERLCDEGRLTEATSLSMKHLLDARARYGIASQNASDHMIIVAEVARRRGKFHLAQKLYDKSLGIQANSAMASKVDSAPISEQDRIVWLKNQVGRQCDAGNLSGAIHASMSELLRARSSYGVSHPYTAQYTAIVGDVARIRGKYHLASVLYQKAFAVLQDEIGTTDSKKTAQELTEPSSF